MTLNERQIHQGWTENYLTEMRKAYDEGELQFRSYDTPTEVWVPYLSVKHAPPRFIFAPDNYRRKPREQF